MRIAYEEILYLCFQIHFVCPTADWRREMLNLAEYEGERFETAADVFFQVAGDIEGLFDRDATRGSRGSLTRQQFDAYRLEVVRQTFADLKNQSECKSDSSEESCKQSRRPDSEPSSRG